MANTYTAIAKHVGDGWIGWIEEVQGVNCQEPTRDELIEILRLSLREALAFNREDAIRAAASDYSEVPRTCPPELGPSRSITPTRFLIPRAILNASRHIPSSAPASASVE